MSQVSDSSPLTPDSPTWSPDSYPPDPLQSETEEKDSGAPQGSGPGEHGKSAALHPPAGTLLQGERYRFRLRHAIGSGGMGSVYLAETLEEITGRETESSDLAARPAPPPEVAVKFMNAPEGLDPETLLKRELSSVRALQHPRIPQLYDWSTTPPTMFAAFHYYPAGSLTDQIVREGWLEAPAVWRLLEDLLQALTAAHRACILHLDVKPGNVLCDGTGGYLLSDFGISQGRLVSRAVIPTGLGAPVFQSPEQRLADHESFDARTDLWGVGITAWVALTGIPGRDLRDLRLACMGGSHGLPPPSQFRPGVPARLEKLLMPLLATDPANRPGAAAQVLAELRAELGGNASAQARSFTAADANARRLLFESLMDPLWRSLFRAGNLDSHLVHYQPGEEICREGAERYETYVLLRGAVNIVRDGVLLASESREGTFLGEVTALTGTRRTATMIAQTEAWAAVFNPAELEAFVTRHPAVAIRLIKALADRVLRESQRQAPARPAGEVP